MVRRATLIRTSLICLTFVAFAHAEGLAPVSALGSGVQAPEVPTVSAPSAPPATLPAPDLSDNVRVRLLRLTMPLSIEGDGLEVRGMRVNPIKGASLPKTESIKVDLSKLTGGNVWIVKKGVQTARTSEPMLEVRSSSGKLRVGGYEVPSPILLSSKGTKKAADVIAALKVDDYLVGVLAGEMPPSWPLEALKSQAVAARSYTLYQMKSHINEPYQLEGNILDQNYVYSLPDGQAQKIKEAVRDTANMVLMEHGRIVKAYYHSDCGGQTEDPSSIWGEGSRKSAIVSVKDAFCAFSPQSKWSLELSFDELREKLQSAGENLGDLKEAKIISRTPSQRAGLIAFNDGVHDVLVSGNDLRKIIGFARLKSTLFSIAQKEKSLLFTGRGFGHGGGLCQWGAKYLATKGATVAEILHHYYPQATLSDTHVANR